MSIRPLLKLLKNDQLLAFTNSAALLKPFYKLVYLAAARKGGLFDVLWGLTERVRIETADIRERVPDERYDIVTLYNNIYYFPVEDRVSLLRHVKGFMNSGGFLLLTTCCQGGTLEVEVLNLWGAATATGGRLPKRDEIVRQLQDAGYKNVKTIRPMPGEAFYAFKAISH